MTLIVTELVSLFVVNQFDVNDKLNGLWCDSPSSNNKQLSLTIQRLFR